MIQDIAPHIYHNEYKPVQPEEDSFLLYFEEKRALADWDGEELSFPRFRDYPEVERKLSGTLIYLFSIDDQHFYLAKELRTPERKGYRLDSIRNFRTAAPQWLSFAGITAHQLWHWYDSHVFCGHCGSRWYIRKKNGCFSVRNVDRRNIRRFLRR